MPVLRLLDAGWIGAAAFGACIAASWVPWGGAPPAGQAAGLGIAAVILFASTARMRGLYADAGRPGQHAGNALLTWATAFTCLAATVLATDRGMPPASTILVLLLLFGIGAAGLAGNRWIAVRIPMAGGRIATPVIVVTEPGHPLPTVLRQTIVASGRRIVLEIPVPPCDGGASFMQALDTLIGHVRDQAVEEILLAIDWHKADLIDAIAARLRTVPPRVSLMSDEMTGRLLSGKLVRLGDATLVELRQPPLSQPQRAGKRALDLVVGSLALLFLLPVLAVISALIRIDSPGPIVFRQRRTGYNGQLFSIYKFRTMTTLDDGAIVRQACRGDGRVTRVGAFLRRHSLDELPQLINVLKGDMSLVGPRPHALAHDLEYGRMIAMYPMRHNVKPGITGWAQVNGWRGATPELSMMVRRVEHDIWYVDHWSLWLDLKILMLTALGAARAQNAY